MALIILRVAELIREHIRPYKEPSIETHIAAYQRWREAYGAAWQIEEKQYYEARLIANLTPEELHKERMAKLGKEYCGVRPVTSDTLRTRKAHCYLCKQALDNSVDVECVACGWIICKCGACGCGFSDLS